MRVKIVDTTLRDGEQAPGIAFSLKQKIRLASELDKLGVDIIEAGIPAMGREEIKMLKILSKMNLKARLMTWNRMKKSDIEKSLETGIENVHISVPVSDRMIKNKINSNRERVICEMKSLVEFAISKGLTVSVGAEDASRADMDYLLDFYYEVTASGAERIRYSDTVGLLDPFSAYRAIAAIKEEIPVPLDFHGHNDFGMATANAFAAGKAGAEYVSCTINGIGERAGNTSLDEIVLSMMYMEEATSKINVSRLSHISALVEKYSGKANSLSKPIVGKEVFTHESGIHVDGMIKDKNSYAYLKPEILGRSHEFILGKHSGISSVKYIYEKKGIILTDCQAARILEEIRK